MPASLTDHQGPQLCLGPSSPTSGKPLRSWGVDLLDRKEAHSVDSSGTLENVVEQLARFRSDVRAFALSVEDTPPGEPVPASQRPRSERLPLLKACDTLRKDLAPLGVHIRDRGPNSTWEISQKRSAGQDKEK
ncbi:probable cysteine--tRNA ligase, mitochondrial [Coregonus clupeaformis]|uniref:probable cysteine--tRNA ligase, mitochondrial n=1 Tax=Coregonus clupeaformis TaxID=59861 RepID=UPI001E1C5472|nr:probable cysteine--tRNA ligase, mitochondrial [Coregonus clupeaformis]